MAFSSDGDGIAGPERFLAASTSHLDVWKGSLVGPSMEERDIDTR
jgi:hypothetical protein